MSGTILLFIVLLAQVYTISYDLTVVILLFRSGFFCLELPSLDSLYRKLHLDKGKVFIHCITYSTDDITMILVHLVYGKDWHMHIHCYFIYWLYLSITLTCSSLAQINSIPGGNTIFSACISNSLSPWYDVMMNPLVTYIWFKISNPFMILPFDLKTHVWTEQKLILPDLVSRKINPLT